MSTLPPATVDDRGVLENTALTAMGCIVALLASSLVWVHYYLLVIPMVIFALRPWNSPRPMNFLNVLMLRLVPILSLLLLLDTEIVTVLDGVVSSKTYWSWATSGSAIALFVVGLWQFAYGIRDRRDQETNSPG